AGYDGDLAVEGAREGDALSKDRRGAEYAQRVLAELGAERMLPISAVGRQGGACSAPPRLIASRPRAPCSPRCANPVSRPRSSPSCTWPASLATALRATRLWCPPMIRVVLPLPPMRREPAARTGLCWACP